MSSPVKAEAKSVSAQGLGQSKDDSKTLSQDEMARKKAALAAKSKQAMTLRPGGKTTSVPLHAQSSVRSFLDKGGKLTCLFCKNEVTGKQCGFCGSTEFKFIAPEANVKKPNTLKSGFLVKEGGGYKTWLERYFVLTDDGLLAYYTSDKVDVKQLFEKRGKLKVSGAKLQEWERGCVPMRDGYFFAITSTSKQSRTYIMEAKSFEEREAWVTVLKANGAAWDGVKTMTKFNPSSVLEGWLTKQGGRIKTWRRRYFVMLKGSNAAAVELQYWAATTDKKMKDNIILTNSSVIERDTKANTFAVKSAVSSDRRYLITAYDSRERETWIQALCLGIGQEYKPPTAQDEKKSGSPLQPSRSTVSQGGSPQQPQKTIQPAVDNKGSPQLQISLQSPGQQSVALLDVNYPPAPVSS
jgi:hypothetical protein